MISYKHSEWTFKPKNQEIIYKDGRVLQIPTRISACLTTLIEANGSTVTYDELLNKVWRTTYKDSSTVSSVISEVRKRIGCGQDSVKLVVTIPKRGYRFTGDVTIVYGDETVASADSTLVVDPSQETDSAAVTLTEQQNTIAPQTSESQQSIDAAVAKSRVNDQDAVKLPLPITEPMTADYSVIAKPTKTWLHKTLLAFSLVSCLVLMGVFVEFGLSSMRQDNIVDATPTFSALEIITHEEGGELEFDVSNNGRWLVYSHRAQNSEKRRIFLKDLVSGRVQGLPVENDEDNYQSPSFSSDMSKIAFIKNTKKACEVWMLDFTALTLQAAKIRKITECGLSGFWSTTGFSEDGSLLFFSRSNSLTEPFRVYHHDLITGYERNLTAPTSSGRGDYSFSLSPDGLQMAIVRNLLWQSTSIQVKSFKDGSSRSIIELPYLIEHIDWYSDHEIIYSGENWQLYLHDIYTDKRTTLADIGQPFSYVVVADKRVFAYKGLAYKSSLWRIDTSTEGAYNLKKEFNSPYLDASPTKGQNGDLFFLSNRSGTTELWKRNGDAYSRVSGDLPKHIKNLHYSAQSNALFGVSEKRLFRFNLEESELTWLSSNHSKIRNLSLSNDNRLIYSEEENENWLIKSLDISSSVVENMKLPGFTAHQVDEFIYYTLYRKAGLWKFNTITRKSEKLIDGFNATSSSYWDIQEGKIYVVDSEDSLFKVYSLSDGKLLDDSLVLSGQVKHMQCYGGQTGCLLDINQPGETEIIEFKP